MHRLSFHLFFLSRLACTESKINTIGTTGKSYTTGPLVYLLKLLVCQGGFSCLKKITNDQQLKWMVPKEFEQNKVNTCVVNVIL